MALIYIFTVFMNHVFISFVLCLFILLSIIGSIRLWKRDVLEPSVLIANGDIGLCKIVDLRKRQPILCGTEYIEWVRYCFFIEEGIGVKTIYGEIAKPMLIHRAGIQNIGDIRRICYGPEDPNLNQLDILQIRNDDIRNHVSYQMINSGKFEVIDK